MNSPNEIAREMEGTASAVPRFIVNGRAEEIVSKPEWTA